MSFYRTGKVALLYQPLEPGLLVSRGQQFSSANSTRVTNRVCWLAGKKLIYKESLIFIMLVIFTMLAGMGKKFKWNLVPTYSDWYVVICEDESAVNAG